MPQMNGPRLYERLIEERPGTAVLFVSGFGDEFLGQNQQLPSGAPLLQKPFSSETLVRKVRELLDQHKPGAP